MYRNIVVGYDGTDQSEDALALACRLAAITDGQVTLAFVYRGKSIPVQIGSAAIGVRMGEEAEAVLNRGSKQVPPGISASTVALPDSSPAHALHDLAERDHADLIVLGSSKRGPIGRVTAGSVATRLLHGSPCAVAVAGHGSADDLSKAIERIGLGFDASAESELALTAATALARDSGAHLHVITAVEPHPLPYPGYPAAELPDYLITPDIGEERIEAALSRVPEAVKATGHTVLGKPSTALAQHAKDAGLDLLVSGSRGYGPVGRVLLGGVSTKLVRKAPCSVLVVPRSAAAHDSDPARREQLTGAAADG